MSQMYPLSDDVTFIFTDAYFEKLILERESIVAICHHNNQQKRKVGNKKKKEKSLKQMIASLDGEELDNYLKEQGFTVNNVKPT